MGSAAISRWTFPYEVGIGAPSAASFTGDSGRYDPGKPDLREEKVPPVVSGFVCSSYVCRRLVYISRYMTLQYITTTTNNKYVLIENTEPIKARDSTTCPPISAESGFITKLEITQF